MKRADNGAIKHWGNWGAFRGSSHHGAHARDSSPIVLRNISIGVNMALALPCRSFATLFSGHGMYKREPIVHPRDFPVMMQLVIFTMGALASQLRSCLVRRILLC